MNKHRLVVVTLCMLAVAGVTAGCGDKAATSAAPSGATSTAASPSPSAVSPKDALLASIKAFDQATFEFQGKHGTMTINGKLDPAKKAAAYTATGKELGVSLTMNFVVIGTDVWLKVDLGAAANRQLGVDKNKWMSIDTTKITDKDGIPSANGSSIPGEMLGGVVNAERVDDTHFKGTVDVTQAKNYGPERDVLDKVGDKAKAVPFTAAIDTKGRLTELKTDGTGIDPGLSIAMTFTNFGSAVSITKPTGAVPAPAAVYSMLNA